ncbi:MAG: NAD(+)/NADH kinase [Desulfovibrionaceae bacterium]|nr:NAD(+)/NADH kinase [Desulfovibrionaceae bacterium]
MTAPLTKILVVTKPGDDSAISIRKEIVAFLRSRGVDAQWCEHRVDAEVGECVPDRCDLVVILGGDGTFIGVARRLHGLGAPFMGVNLGRVGFLAQLHRDHWREWFATALADGFDVSRRLVLEYDVLRRGETVHHGLIVNDLVVSRGELARLIRLSVAFDGMEISTLRADGLIVSTPSGSSAYGVSAGGPLVHTGLGAYCVTPVCPFLNSFKPMVFPADGVTSVRVEEAAGAVNLTEDGQSVIGLEYGDEVVLRRAEEDLSVVDFGPRAYFEKLKKNGFLTEK